MKIIAIAIKTKPLEVLTLGMASFLEELLMDKRLKKAEAIKAYRASDAYKAKRDKYQKTHAEYGQIAEIAITSDDKVGVREGESRALEFLEQELKGAGKIVGFDLQGQLEFILRRVFLIAYGDGELRRMLFTSDGTATTATVDIKKIWMQTDKSYSGLTLAQLCKYAGLADTSIPRTTETEAFQTMKLYRQMEGNLL
jgi:hypothetical protein